MASLNDIETKIKNIINIISAWPVNTITSALPLTFLSNGTALIDYRIYGTADGAGVQTENLFDFATYKSKLQLNPYPVANGTVSLGDNSITITADSNDAYTRSYSPIDRYVYTVTVEPNTEYTLSWKSDDTKYGRVLIFYYEGENTMYTINKEIQQKIGNLTITTTSTTNKLSFRFGVQSAGESLTYSDIMLVKGSTPPSTYIPYGYKIPLTVTSGTESKTADIYIGDSKLLSGDYIDYESGKIVRNGTLQDPPLQLPELETFEGTNTLDSTETLGEVTIKGKIKEVI